MVFASQTNNYAQAGYTISPGQSLPYTYGEFTYPGHCQPSGSCTSLYTTTNDGDNYQYWENYNPLAKQIYMYQGYGNGLVVELANTPYDPADSSNSTYWWGNAWYSEYSGENINPQDDMPGTAAKKATFTSVNYEPTLDNGNEPPTTLTGLTSHQAFSDEQTYWCVQMVNSTAFNLWTNGGCPPGTPS